MRLLKLLLYTILLICISWGLLILAGPKLIDIAVKAKFGDAVKLSGVKVSPKLSLSASRIDISKLNIEGVTISEGSLRAAEFSWREFFSGRPVINVQAAYANFDEEIELDFFSIDLRPKTNFAFNEYTAQLKLENLAVSDAFVLAQATAEADLELVDFIVRNLHFNLQGLEAQENVRLNSDLVFGSLSEWQISNKLTFQETLLEISFDSLDISTNSDNFEVNNFSVEGSLRSNTLHLNFKGGSSKFSSGIGVNEFDIQSVTHDLSQGLDLIDITFSLSDLILPSREPNENNKEINFLSGSLARNARSLGQIYLKGTLGAFELFFQNQLLANISQATVQVEGRLVEPNQLFSKVAIVKENFVPATFTGEVKLEHELDDLIDCALNKCVPEKLNATYEINLEDNRLIGVLDCKLLDCFDSPNEHTLETLDTQKFFQSLVKTNILNPVISIVFYNAILSGEKTGDGNILKF